MSPLLIALRRFVLVVLGLLMLAAVAVVVRSAQVRSRTWEGVVAATWPGVVPSDAVSVAEGARLARVLGCADCHGERLQGRALPEALPFAEVIAPNLTRVVPGYGDPELVRLLRHGVRRNGTGVFVMPAPAFFHLSDADIALVLAYLRRLPREEGHEQATSFTPRAHAAIAVGRLRPVPDAMDHGATRVDPGTPDDTAARGRYLAHVACTECHGSSFEGGMAGKAPPLAIAQTYTDEGFRHLMRTGETPGRRDLFVMDDTARARFAHFTDAEIQAVLTFLRTLGR
ncbi:c-type cytochrome [Luteitalea sp.]